MKKNIGSDKNMDLINYRMRVIKDFIEEFYDKTIFGDGKKDGADYSPTLIKSLASFTDADEEYRVGELGKNAKVKSSTITDMVDRLEKEGFADRVRDHRDRRVVKVRLTKKGQKAKMAFTKRMRADGQALFAKLREEETRQLVQHLEAACNILKKIQ